ncbi:MAG: lysoplasmalogenase, partial [Clostridia bacterium]|nr:lysoplasmalogenase [Clostridia bacterium]
MTTSLILAGFSLVFCVLFCWFRAKEANVYSLLLKIISSVCFILSGIFAVISTKDLSISLYIVVGLVFGLVGDILLDLKIMYPQDDQQYFNAGTVAFMFGHIFYFLATINFNYLNAQQIFPWNLLISISVAVLITLAIMLLSKPLKINFGKSLIISAIYCFVLSLMLCYSISVAIYLPIFWIFAGGMFMFFVSDLVLSMQYFGGKTSKVLIYVNHITYYIAQIMLAISILF